MSLSDDVSILSVPHDHSFLHIQDSGEFSVDEFGRTVQQVLEKGKEIICLAQQAKKAYESNCC